MSKEYLVWFLRRSGIFIGLDAIIEKVLVSLEIPIAAGFGSSIIAMVLLIVFDIIGAIMPVYGCPRFVEIKIQNEFPESHRPIDSFSC